MRKKWELNIRQINEIIADKWIDRYINNTEKTIKANPNISTYSILLDYLLKLKSKQIKY